MPRTEAQKLARKPRTEAQKLARYEHDHTDEGLKKCKISHWKQQGLVWTSEEEIDEIYARWLANERCEKKGCEYTETNWKCMDHEHLLGDFGPFRNILCHRCNVNDKTNNTSGYPNISKKMNGHSYQKTVDGITHSKWFKNKEDAIKYKIQYELNN